MTQPTKEDIRKRQEKLDKLLKGLNEDGSMPEGKLCTQLRSAVRQVWMYHPTKLSFMMKKSFPDMDMTTRTKWLIPCSMCKNNFKLTDVACDHKKGEHSLKTFDDLIDFANSILGVSHDDLDILCHNCHNCKTFSERYGVTLEEAFKEKPVIAKINQKVAVQKKELLKAGYLAKDITNEEKRRNCYRELLNKEQ